MFTAVTYTDGSAVTTIIICAATARGYITLTSLDGSAIKISDGDQDNDTDNGANRIGFNLRTKLVTLPRCHVSSRGFKCSSNTLDSAIESVSKFRASFGAYEKRLDAAINNLVTLQVNTDAARSRIEDADFAEISQLTKAQILSQAATSMLAQANASKNSLLALLQG